MILQGFDVVDHSIEKVVKFLERIETAEKMETHLEQTRSGQKSNRPDRGGNKRQGKTAQGPGTGRAFEKRQCRNEQSWCPLHETRSHDLGECKVMLDQAKKMRANFAAQTKARPNTRNLNKNKTWRRADDVGQKDLHALVESTKKGSLTSATWETAQKRKAEPSIEDELNNFAILKMETFSDSD